MSGKKSWGRTVDGKELTEELIAEYVKEAEEGYDVDEMLERRRGRPPIGNGPATVESVRIDPELPALVPVGRLMARGEGTRTRGERGARH